MSIRHVHTITALLGLLLVSLACPQARADRACRSPQKPRAFCDVGAKIAATEIPTYSFSDTLDAIASCRDNVANCISEMVQVDNIMSSGRAILKLKASEVRQWPKKEWGPRQAKFVALLGLLEGLRTTDRNRKSIDDLAQLAWMDARSYEVLLRETWAGLNQQMQACTDVKRVFRSTNLRSGGGLTTTQIKTASCAVRLQFNSMTAYRLLEAWPGCECTDSTGSSGRFFKAGDQMVCVAGLTPGMPIDERMPKAVGKFVDNLSKWSKQHGLRIKEVRAGGCGVTKFVSGGLNERLKHADREKNVALDMELVSGHAELRSCDLKWVSFEPLDCDSKHCQQIRLGLGSDDDCAFSQALMAYEKSARGGLPMALKGKARVPPSCGTTRIDWSALPRGVVDYRKLQSKVEADDCPNGMSKKQWEQLKLGVAVRNSAVDGGLIIIDGVVDNNHIDHFHMSLSPRADEWKAMNFDVAEDESDARRRDADKKFMVVEKKPSSDKSRDRRIELRERIVECRLRDEVGVEGACDISNELTDEVNNSIGQPMFEED